MAEVTFTPEEIAGFPQGPQGVQGDPGSGSGSLTLASSSAAGDSTLTLAGSIPAHVAANTGFLVIDPFSPACEVRKVLSVSGQVITLAPAFSTAKTNVHFDSARKVIEQGRRISLINGNGTTVTVVTTSPHGLSSGNTVCVSGTAAYNTFSTGTVQAKTITVVDATTFTYAAATTGSETSGSVVISSRWAQMVNIFDTSTVVISGTANNNGAFTVTASGRDSPDLNAITVSQPVVEETVAGSVTFKVNLNKAHAAGTAVLWMSDPRIPLVWYGYKADGQTASATANRLALQRANDDSYWCGRFTVVFPASASVALIDGPVYQEREVPWVGTSPISTSVKAHTTFPASPDVYMCHVRYDGRVCYPSFYNNQLGRMMQRGINWNGGNVQGVGGGLFVTSQQPAQGLEDVRCQNFVDGTGLRIQETQQFTIGQIMLIANRINLHLRSAEHVTIGQLDSETPGSTASGGCHVKMDRVASAAAGNGMNNLDFNVLSGHLEDTGVVSTGFDISNAVGLKVVTYHSIMAGSTTAKVNAGSGHSGSLCDYDFYVTYGGSPTSAYALTDADRGVTNKPAAVGSNKRVQAFGTNPGKGATVVADGGTIPHFFGEIPTVVNANGAVAGEVVSVTAISASAFTVAIKKHDGTPGTSQIVYWAVNR